MWQGWAVLGLDEEGRCVDAVEGCFFGASEFVSLTGGLVPPGGRERVQLRRVERCLLR